MLRRKTLQSDLCVVGGGMAGICAAIAAARNGASVVLMHERPVLGGNASSEIRMWICGADGENNRETGIIEEIALENYYRNPTKNYYIWDSILYDFVKREKNITLLLNCTCMDAETEKGSYAHGREIKITQVTGYQLTTQTFFDIQSSYYADCSGDSILAPLTGAQFRMGREGSEEFGEMTLNHTPDNLTMGMSCLLQGRETNQPIPYIPPSYSAKLSEEDFKSRNPDIYNNYENFWYLELGGTRDCIHDTGEITDELLSLAAGTWDYIKNSGKFHADHWELEFMGFLPGKRESRRMMGEYIITQKDISENKVFEDTVAYGGWPLDDHYPSGFYHSGEPNISVDTPAPYCVPYRAMYSKNVDNLFFAGRNISATHMAMSSVRVMATCALIGQAVGTAAAIAAENGLSPHGVYRNKLTELQERLLRADCFLPHKLRERSKLCAAAAAEPITASLYDGQDRPNRIYQTNVCGISVPNGTPLEYRFTQPQLVSSVHIVFDSDLNRQTLPGDVCERMHSMRCNIKLDSPQFYVPKTLCKEFVLKITTPEGEQTLLGSTCNLQRAYDIPLDQRVTKITLIPLSNWGTDAATTVFSFDFRT